jgi:hypothetical protein
MWIFVKNDCGLLLLTAYPPPHPPEILKFEIVIPPNSAEIAEKQFPEVPVKLISEASG